MRTVVGVFRSLEAAQKSVQRLLQAGLRQEDINLLTPSDPERIHQLPLSETESEGLGTAMGGFIGGALGAAAGLGGGAAVASLLVPGVGPVMAVGFAATAILGLGGAAAGAKAGRAIEDRDTHGIAEDEIFVYEDALRKGRTLVVVLAPVSESAERARDVLKQAGAESLDAAREDWWLGLRDAELEEYPEISEDESTYRRGFAAALANRGRAWEACPDQEPYAHEAEHPVFRRGYERGREHCRELQQNTPGRPKAAGLAKGEDRVA